MPPRDWLLRVDDILVAIERIEQAMAGVTLEQFTKDQDRIEIAAFNFIKLGEAAGRLPEHVTSRVPEVDWARARQMRNYIAHVYWGISPSLMWATAHNELPEMVDPLQRLIDEHDDG